jgi:N-formylglutamate amidohydrolase
LKTFGGDAVYQRGLEPDAVEVSDRVTAYWEPYHQCLQGELDQLLQCHGHAVLLDAHSILSHVPLLFEGKLPDLNLGSNGGRSAAPQLRAAAFSVLSDKAFSAVLDGRFKGGYITRHYGDPQRGLHALQLEMAQSAYMQELPPSWMRDPAEAMQDLLRELVQTLMDWKPA